MDEGTLHLHLPALRRLDIAGLRQRGRLRLDRDSLLEASQLEFLSLEALEAATLMPDCLTGLTALATLELKGCGLVLIPTALTALQGSLTRLALPFNDNLQLAESDFAILLTLRKLRMLDMQKYSLTEPLDNMAAVALSAHVRYVPAPWSERSLQHLVTLQSAFQSKHRIVLALDVHVHSAADNESPSEEEDDEGNDD